MEKPVEKKKLIVMIILWIVLLSGIAYVIINGRMKKVTDQNTITVSSSSSSSSSSSDSSSSQAKTYSHKVIADNDILLTGDDVMEISETDYTFKNNITLQDNAKLIIRDSLITHEFDYTFQYELKATENSKVVFENSELQTACTGAFNWNFFDNASLEAENIAMPDCNIWTFFTNEATADIKNWERLGGTWCDEAVAEISDSTDMEIELCYPEGVTIDEELPIEIDEFTFPNENDKNVTTQMHITNSTIDGWGIGVMPQSSITIRNTPAVTVSIIIGYPWQNQTVTIEDLASKLYKDKTWNIVDSELHFINTAAYGWEPNAFGNNTLIIKNSDYSGSSNNSGTAKYIIENSTTDLLQTQENVQMTVRDSIVTGDVIATDDSTITLINTKVEGNIVEEGNGRVIVQ